jgi:NADPH:quinone reductase-like Zn-dependent oxidoreductase
MGTFAVQIAKYFGAEVTGVDSASKFDLLRSIGMNKWEMNNDSTEKRSVGYCLLCAGKARTQQTVPFHPFCRTLNNQEDLAFLAELCQAGKVVPVIDRRYPLSEVPEALRYLEKGRALGK